jgi:hypothetical protein
VRVLQMGQHWGFCFHGVVYGGGSPSYHKPQRYHALGTHAVCAGEACTVMRCRTRQPRLSIAWWERAGL